ncbi:MAG: class I SAM-dependent rRNA methyltransferase [Acidobacteriota bacterium]|nr:class I SAM-dependent rRNA methyltransferase [Acidobacteriota bacterium]MDQ7088309.1 class I SAM-dependent rRNA methyltransferase [Acidobacteriota bacterium]
MKPGAFVMVNGRGARRARRGHPWIFSDDVVRAEAVSGQVVDVRDRGGACLARAVYSSTSRIALRRVAPAGTETGSAFWIERAEAALARRRQVGLGPCRRLVHADADGFPGLTVDRYGEGLVFQATTAWADRAAPEIVSFLGRRLGCRWILARNDVDVRRREGLETGVDAVEGMVPDEIVVDEAGQLRIVSPRRGHKTGLYLDQQENHRAASRWIRGRVLDLFCGEGGFALPLAAAGSRVVAVDQARAGLDRADRAALAAGLDRRIEWLEANVFDFLADADRRDRCFDGIVLDPPPFARHRKALAGGLKGLRDLHRRALRRLVPGGRLLTFSCSFAVSQEAFESAVRAGAEEAGVRLAVLGRPGPAPDHPEALEVPESRYLRGLLLERRAES